MQLNAPVDLAQAAWPVERLAEAIQQLAQRAGLPTDPTFDLAACPAPTTLAGGSRFAGWLTAVAAQLDLEIEAVESSYADLLTLVQNAAPALIQLPAVHTNDSADGSPSYLLLLKGGQRYVTLLTPRLKPWRVRPEQIVAALSDELVAPQLAMLAPLLAGAGITPERQLQVARTILAGNGGEARQRGALRVCWLLRAPINGSGWQQLHQLGLLTPGMALVVGYTINLLLTLAAWWLIGQSAIAGTLDSAWLGGWALLLLTALPVRAWASNAQAHLALGTGAWLKQRLLVGALQLDPTQLRQQGAGQFLGRVLDAENVEQLGLASGFGALLAILQLGSAAFILRLGAGGWGHLLLLFGWSALLLGLGWLYLRRQQAWHETYRTMTNDLVERMVGHRTRLVQEAPQQWHKGEDTMLATYLRQSAAAEQLRMLMAVIPRGWMVLALLVLFAMLLFTPVIASEVTTTELAISLGGMLLALQAFTSCVAGIQSLIGARAAWQQVAPLLPSPQRSPVPSATAAASLAQRPVAIGQPLLLAQDLAFHYQVGGNPVLRGCTLQIRQGDRLLLEGPSGGGKSTLAALLGGLQLPTGGLLLWRGFDYPTLGTTAWRQQIGVVPQFHENHILTGTLAFNLLLGRRWPPTPADLTAAEEICRELGLGDLLDRMPAGLQQLVGESGWQLSHGERSRLYMARAILQQADLMILDESFAALDPANAQLAFSCVNRHAPTLLVIAHP